LKFEGLYSLGESKEKKEPLKVILVGLIFSTLHLTKKFSRKKEGVKLRRRQKEEKS